MGKSNEIQNEIQNPKGIEKPEVPKEKEPIEPSKEKNVENNPTAKPGKAEGPINTLDPKGNPSEINPRQKQEEISSKEEIEQLKNQIKSLNERIEVLAQKPEPPKKEIEIIENQIENKQKQVDWILDQYAGL